MLAVVLLLALLAVLAGAGRSFLAQDRCLDRARREAVTQRREAVTHSTAGRLGCILSGPSGPFCNVNAAASQGEIVESWPFVDKPNTASITTRQVLEGAPILLVTHDADDGSWQFLCGSTDDPADARVVGLGQMYKRDATLGALSDLPEGWRASRASADLPWRRDPA